MYIPFHQNEDQSSASTHIHNEWINLQYIHIIYLYKYNIKEIISAMLQNQENQETISRTHRNSRRLCFLCVYMWRNNDDSSVGYVALGNRWWHRIPWMILNIYYIYMYILLKLNINKWAKSGFRMNRQTLSPQPSTRAHRCRYDIVVNIKLNRKTKK